MIETANFKETKLHRRLSFWIRVFVLMPIIAALLVGVVIGSLSIFAPLLLTDAQNAVGGVLGSEVANPLLTTPETSGRASLIVLGGIGTLIVWPMIYAAWFSGPLGRAILAVQRFFGASTYSSGGAARFAGMTAEALSSYGNRASSVYLGRSLFAPWWRLGWKPEKHLLTLAGSRGGKGAGVIIPNLLKWQGSALVIDPKGTNTSVTAQRRRDLGGLVHVLDPFNVTREPSAGFNPLDYVDPSSVSVVEDIDVIASSIVPASKDGRDSHWSDSASAILSGFIAHVLTSSKFSRPSLLDVRELVHLDGEELGALVFDMSENDACGGLAQQAARAIVKGQKTNEFHSVMSTLKRHMKWLNSEGYSELMRASTFNVDEMKDRETTVYLVLPPDLIAEQSGFLRLFLNVALNRYVRGGRAKVPSLFMVDETAALGYVKRLPRAYRELASYNLRVWTFWQSKSDMDEIYGSEAQSFITNSDAIQCFALADEDCDWIARMIGTRAMVDDVTRTSAVMGFRDRTSIAKEIAAPSPSDPWFGKMYVLRSGRNAHLVENVPYHKSGMDYGKASPDPDFPNTRPPLSMWPAYLWSRRQKRKTVANKISPQKSREKSRAYERADYLYSEIHKHSGARKVQLSEEYLDLLMKFAEATNGDHEEVRRVFYGPVVDLVRPYFSDNVDEDEKAMQEFGRLLNARYHATFKREFFKHKDLPLIYPEQNAYRTDYEDA